MLAKTLSGCVGMSSGGWDAHSLQRLSTDRISVAF